MKPALTQALERLTHWMRDEALPLWREHGIDHKLGGCYDRLLDNGEPDLRANKQMKVQAQFIYIMARSKQLGWSTGGQEIIKAMANFVSRYGTLPCRSDGYVRALDAQLEIIDSAHDLQDHAYFILSSIATYSAFSDGSDLRRAHNIIEWLDIKHAHREGGWTEGSYSSSLRRSRSHLQVFVAFIYLFEVTQKPLWLDRARVLHSLFLNKLYHRELRLVWDEYDDQWGRSGSGLTDRLSIESLLRWSSALGRFSKATGESCPEAAELYESALKLGRDARTGLFAEVVTSDGKALSRTKTCRTLSEYVRASLYRLEAGDLTAETQIIEGIDLLFQYFISKDLPGGCFNLLGENNKSLLQGFDVASLFALFETSLLSTKALSGRFKLP
jgi:mannose/cellobiose epimerase-like protein (N-acyl-D-glucosamine 2-epimerase family)